LVPWMRRPLSQERKMKGLVQEPQPKSLEWARLPNNRGKKIEGKKEGIAKNYPGDRDRYNDTRGEKSA